jgi:ubiquinone/menaquinone biosynthesis C-methylase UbiE
MKEDHSVLQRKYYSDTASSYDDVHVSETDEHGIALTWLSSLIGLYKFNTLLDVGCGTGRCARTLKRAGLPLTIVGIEPVKALRDIARQHGLHDTEIRDGDALALPFDDGSFDIVSAFGILHHIKDHRRAVREMCRVARRGVFISDANNFGQGSVLIRAMKQSLNLFGLWPVFDFIRTKGKGYHYLDGDGIFYSYSVFDDVPVLLRRFEALRFLSTMHSGGNLYRTAPHLAVFASNI